MPQAVVQLLPAVTPYMYALRCARDEEIAAEYERYLKARVASDRELTSAKAHREPFTIDMDHAARQVEKLSGDLTEEELNRRGPAELDEERWPLPAVRERRKRTQRGAQLAAEEEWRQASARMRVASLAVEHARLAFDGRMQESQAAGWQIVHHYGRREANYLCSLARKHKNGPALVEMLRLSDRQLPDWLLRTEDEKEEES